MSRGTAHPRSTAGDALLPEPRRSGSTARPTAGRTSRSRRSCSRRRPRTVSARGRHRRRLVPGRHHESGARSEQPQDRLCGRRRLRALAVGRRGLNWTQVFHTLNQNSFGTKTPGDTFGDRVEFEAVNLGGGKTRIYLGDSSDDLLQARVWRTDDAAAIAGDPNGAYGNGGWTELSSPVTGRTGSWRSTIARTASAATTTSSPARPPSSASARGSSTRCGSAAR
jgi:hypothetical protein